MSGDHAQRESADRLNAPLLVIVISATGFGICSALLLSYFSPTPVSYLVTQHVPGNVVVLFLAAAAAAVVLARGIRSVSAVHGEALRDKEHSEEQRRLLSARLEKREIGMAARRSVAGQQGEKRASIPVLLVDDHAMVRQGLRSVMEGFPNIDIIGEASNGDEALKLVEKRRPAVVLMDINMPKLNGIEATAKIKSEHPEVAVIGLSVNAESINQEAMKKAGASMLLAKEAVITELYNAILTVTNESLGTRTMPCVQH
ncbi:MAG TPA: response regulator transcription factor [Nitrospira sp.]|nr:response regulator transcription factor [Nitrospira sp.]